MTKTCGSLLSPHATGLRASPLPAFRLIPLQQPHTIGALFPSPQIETEALGLGRAKVTVLIHEEQRSEPISPHGATLPTRLLKAATLHQASSRKGPLGRLPQPPGDTYLQRAGWNSARAGTFSPPQEEKRHHSSHQRGQSGSHFTNMG